MGNGRAAFTRSSATSATALAPMIYALSVILSCNVTLMS